MRNLPALIVAVLMGGLILFGLLWLWFWFEQNSSSRGGNGYSSQDQPGYSSQDQGGYNSAVRQWLQHRPRSTDIPLRAGEKARAASLLQSLLLKFPLERVRKTAYTLFRTHSSGGQGAFNSADLPLPQILLIAAP